METSCLHKCVGKTGVVCTLLTHFFFNSSKDRTYLNTWSKIASRLIDSLKKKLIKVEIIYVEIFARLVYKSYTCKRNLDNLLTSYSYVQFKTDESILKKQNK